MLWLIWDACRTPLRQTRLMQFYVWGAVAASASTFLRYFQGRQTYYLRYTAPGFDPNDFGLILALSIPLALYLALRARGWERWCYRAAVLAVLSAVLLTASRTALIATFAAFTFALWTWREADRWQRIASALLLVLLLLGMFQFAPAPSRNRLATISNELTRGTLHNRTLIWKAGLKVLKSHPVVGVSTLTWEHYKPGWLLMALMMTEWARSYWPVERPE